MEDSEIFSNDSEYTGKKINPVPAPTPEIGVDVNDTLFDNIIVATNENSVNTGQIESFTRAAQSRDQVYGAIDSMCADSMVSSILETYVDSCTEYNDNGRIVWCDSSDDKVLKYVNFLLDSFNVDKHIYEWAYSLCKYGDLYLRLYRTSETEDELFDDKKQKLDENVELKYYSKRDKYVYYVEMVKNPAELFELVRFGKTQGYIKAPITSIVQKDQTTFSQYYTYNFNQKDVEIYQPSSFVHACLQDAGSRATETVNIFLNEDRNINENETKISYTVRNGQSILYDSYKIWRELMLLEQAMLLNRITKSQTVRIYGIEVGDSPKESIPQRLSTIKQLIEQKSAINVNSSMTEYTNPGPTVNNIYVPTYNGKQVISSLDIGDNDTNVTGLNDIDYFKNKFYGSMAVPKEYFGDTDDAGGFSGGSALSIISTRFAKRTKKIQNALTQMFTDLINLVMYNSGLTGYINKFTIKMLPPTTQEDKDRQENASTKISITRDVMDLISNDIEDNVVKLKMLKSMLADCIHNEEVISILQEQINKIEANEKKLSEEPTEEEQPPEEEYDSSEPLGMGEPEQAPKEQQEEIGLGQETKGEEEQQGEQSEEELPTASQMGFDAVSNT